MVEAMKKAGQPIDCASTPEVGTDPDPADRREGAEQGDWGCAEAPVAQAHEKGDEGRGSHAAG